MSDCTADYGIYLAVALIFVTKLFDLCAPPFRLGCSGPTTSAVLTFSHLVPLFRRPAQLVAVLARRQVVLLPLLGLVARARPRPAPL